jgi:cyclopropane fatty-acyl-phospholipid synthase-like methyltransferase
MAPSQTSLDDRLLYPGVSYPQAHPDRLATMASLFGLNAAPPDRCRVLELGCGHCNNLIPMAYTLPGSQFLGVDISPKAIALAQTMIGELGLGNITAQVGDIAELSADLGQFDYIVAHGVYSWVPPHVQDRLLAVCRQNLAPQGIAYVSYTTFPGSHLRQMLREMLQFHLSRQQQAQGEPSPIKAFTQWLQSATHPGECAAMLKQELDRLREREEAVTHHDELNPDYRPVYFREFSERAASHGLRYVAEAEFYDMAESVRPPEVLATLQQWAGEDRIAKEQYLDFLKCRTFRQTMLCPREREAATVPRLEALSGFLFTLGKARLLSGNLDDLRPRGMVELQTPAGILQTGDLLARGTFKVLSDAAPQALPFAELEERCGALLAPATAITPQGLAEVLLALWQGGVLQAHRHAPNVLVEPSQRPIASPVARCQIEHQLKEVTNLRHASIEVRDPIARQLIRLLDGTRDRAALTGELLKVVRTDGGDWKGAKLHHDPAALGRALAADLEKSLAMLGRIALLVG